MHFGIYLKNKGIITAEQLVAAIEVQLNRLTPIGQLALEEGMISPRDIFDVLRAQREKPSVRFGDLAIDMGLMSRKDLTRLLMLQADRKRSIEEILVGQRVISAEQAETEIMEFRRWQAKRRMGSVVLSKIPPKPRGQKAATQTSETAFVA
jgi:hypothetical protein